MPPDKSVHRLAKIDFLRGVAILGVLIYHANASWLPGGFSGVDIFFVISGYVVTLVLLPKSQQRFFRFITDFYVRRIFRIIPAMIFWTVAAAFLAVALIPDSWLSGSIYGTGEAALLGYSNLYLAWTSLDYFSPDAELNPFTHTWSLGVELQFYLVFPFVMFFVLRLRSARSHWNSILVLLGFGTISVLVGLLGTRGGDGSFYFPIPRFWEFIVGATLCLFHQMSTDHATSYSRTSASIGILLVGVSFIFLEPTYFPVPAAVLPALGAALCIHGLSEPRSVALKLAFRGTASLGLISYSVYLAHWPIIVVMRWTSGLQSLNSIAFAILASIGLGAASYVLIERRANWFEHHVPQFKIPVAAMVIGVSVLSSWVINALGENLDSLSPSITSDHFNWSTEAQKFDVTGFGSLRGRRVFVLGDSHASAYATMLEALRVEEAADVRFLTKPGCPIAAFFAVTEECTKDIQRRIDVVKREAGPGDWIFLPGLRLRRLVTANTLLTDEEIKRQREPPLNTSSPDHEFLSAIEQLQSLSATGANVILEAPKPVFRTFPFRCSDWFNQGNPICALGPKLNREFAEYYRATVLDRMRWAATNVPGVSVWDPMYRLCSREYCNAMDGKLPLFFDSDHLSAHGNRLLYKDFVDFIRGPQPGRSFSGVVDFRKSLAPGIGVQGVSKPEGFGCWTNGSKTTISFQAGLPSNFRIILRTNGSFLPGMSSDAFSIRVGDHTATFIAKALPQEFVFDVEGEKESDIVLDFAPIRSPAELGMSDDPRQLGLALVDLVIEEQ